MNGKYRQPPAIAGGTDKSGIDRRTTSDFGLIGSIIAQLGGEE